MPQADLRRSAVIHNFVDEHVLAGTPARPEPQEIAPTVRVHIAGRLDAPKGIAQFLELLAPKLPPDWCIDVYGDGPLRSSIAAKCQSGQIRLHGHRLYADIVRATHETTVVVVPSIWEESCGTVVLEALRIGIVCFALRRGGTPELAIYGAPGQLKLFDSLPALVDALLATTDFSVEAGGASADVRQHMAALLAIYEGGKNGR